MTVAAVLLAGCSEVAVARPTPTPSAVPTLPPIGFNHRYGNNPVSAADALALERALYAKKQFWEVAVATTPLEGGFVDRADPARVTAARHAAAGLTLVIATESRATILDFIANGHAGQQSYCQGLVDQLAGQGYDGLGMITMYVYFGEQDRHAKLERNGAGAVTYTVYDNDLAGILTPSATSASPTPPPTFFQSLPPG